MSGATILVGAGPPRNPQGVARKSSATTDQRARSGYSPRCIPIHRRCKRLRVRVEGTPKTVCFGLIRVDYAESWIPLSENSTYPTLGEYPRNTREVPENQRKFCSEVGGVGVWAGYPVSNSSGYDLQRRSL